MYAVPPHVVGTCFPSRWGKEAELARAAGYIQYGMPANGHPSH